MFLKKYLYANYLFILFIINPMHNTLNIFYNAMFQMTNEK